MKRIQRAISFLLALVMVIGIVSPMAVSAAEIEPTQVVTEPTEETTEPTDAVTEPVEEPTVPTEAVTEPEEETTAPTETVTEGEVESSAPTEEKTETTEPGFTVGSVTQIPGLSTATEIGVVTGICGENMSWELKNGVLSISGIGEMPDYDIDSSIYAPWYDYRAYITDVMIESGVTGIGNDAFYGCECIASASLPDGLLQIGVNGFYGCSALTSILFPESVQSIGSKAFAYCDSLKTITFEGDAPAVYCPGSGPSAIFFTVTATVFYPENNTTWTSGVQQEFGNLANISWESYRPTVASGDCGTNITWTIDDNGLMFISGSGDMPYRFTEPYDYSWHPYAESVRRLIVDEGITGISNSAFRDFVNLTQARIADSVTSIGRNAFYGCTSLKTVVLPETIDYIHEYTFAACTSLETIVIPDKVTDIARYAFASCSNLQDIQLPEKLHYIAEYAFSGCTSLKELKIPDGCGFSIGIIQNCTGLTRITLPKDMASIPDDLFYGCENLKYILFRGNAPVFEENYRFPGKNLIAYYPEGNDTWTEVVSQDYGGTVTWVPYDPDGVLKPEEPEDPDCQITSLLEDQVIQLNGKGVAYAVFKTGPHKNVRYIVDNATYNAKADENGFARLCLGRFETQTTERITVKITKVGDYEYNPLKTFEVTVSVTPLSFSQSWKATMDAGIAVKIGTGLEGEIPCAEADASLAMGSAGVEGSSALRITREFSGNKETLELISERETGTKKTIKSGITGDFLDSSYHLADISGKKTIHNGVAYGIRIDDYREENNVQQKAIATYLLGETLLTNPNLIFLKPFYRDLADDAFKDSGCIVIDGSSLNASGTLGVNVGVATVNEKDLFSAFEGNANISAELEEKNFSDGGTVRSSTFKADIDLGDVILEKLHLEKSLFGKELLGPEVEISASNFANQKSVEATYLSAAKSLPKYFILGQTIKTEYGKYTFQDKSLDMLVEKVQEVEQYLQNAGTFMNAKNLIEIAKSLSTFDMPIPYSREENEQTLYSVPVEFGISAGLGLGGNVELSYMEETSYATETGYAFDNQFLIAGETDDLSLSVSNKKRDLSELFTNVMGSLAEDAMNFFCPVFGTAAEGVQSGWSWITGKAETAADWIVSILAPDNDPGSSVWRTSYSIRNVQGTEETPENKGFEGAGNYAESQAATIGRPFVISVTDSATGETVADLSAEPLEFTIRYAQEDLSAAGLQKEDPIVQSGGIAMYRYSDYGDYFEKVGGTNDLEAMTVTAMITKPGQYVLAVDSCAPNISYLDVSDYHETPTITAYMSDMSGLDLDRFVFSVDGQIKVDSGNIADFYDQKAAMFTYAVPQEEALSEGAHTVSFILADTSGNYDEYSYSFEVDLTAPVVSDLSVNGVTNEDSVVEICAQVSDPNLTAVYTVLSKKLSDGSWSAEVPVAMSDLGDGYWGLDYEGDGSFIKIYIEAVDIANNNAVSDTLTVAPVLESFTLNQEYLNLKPGQTAQLEAEIQPASLAEFLTWEVEGNSEIISVSETGEVTAQGIGTAYVLGTVADGKTEVTVRCRINVAEKNSIVIEASELAGQDCVWIDGVKYTLCERGDMFCVDVPNSNARTMIAYTYHIGNSTDIHTQYPVSMKVWTLKNENGFYTATRVEELDNILQYSGSSIRVTGKRGIRMITSIEKSERDALISGGLAGFTLKEYGTVVAWADQLDETKSLVLGKSYAKSNYAYKKGIADLVFAYDGDLMQYTNVLVNFSDEQCTKNIALRPYMILEDTEGQTVILYGGIVTRSIGYIAYQNRNTFEFGTEAYGYVWNIIHSVYGDIYDAEFKG